MMDKNILERAGQLLYGRRWQTDLAEEMGITSRQVRGWMAGATIPDRRERQLRQIIEKHHQGLQELLLELS